MIAIYKQNADGSFTRVAAVPDREAASMRLVELMRDDPTASFKLDENYQGDPE